MKWRKRPDGREFVHNGIRCEVWQSSRGEWLCSVTYNCVLIARRGKFRSAATAERYALRRLSNYLRSQIKPFQDLLVALAASSDVSATRTSCAECNGTGWLDDGAA